MPTHEEIDGIRLDCEHAEIEPIYGLDEDDILFYICMRCGDTIDIEDMPNNE